MKDALLVLPPPNVASLFVYGLELKLKADFQKIEELIQRDLSRHFFQIGKFQAEVSSQLLSLCLMCQTQIEDCKRSYGMKFDTIDEQEVCGAISNYSSDLFQKAMKRSALLN